MTGDLSVAIVGLGSRGLSVLERIVTLARSPGRADRTTRVEVVDPMCTGTGLHTTDQPDYLLLNTVCSEVSMFPEQPSVGDETGPSGPSLYEWLTERGVRLAEDGFTAGSEGRPIRPDDFVPRRLLGEYLSWFLERLLRELPSHVRVNLHQTTAVDLSVRPDQLSLLLADGTVLHTGYAFLTVGHVRNDDESTSGTPDERLIPTPYPIPGQLDRIEPGQVVAVGGFGLSAMDVMAALTVGRGGTFKPSTSGNLEYLPSGREPTLLFYSRSGIPYRGRPAANRRGGRYDPVALTRSRIDDLRTEQGGPLHFDRDVLPLMLTEMRIAHHRSRTLRSEGANAEQDLTRELAAAHDRGDLESVLAKLDDRHGGFDALAALAGTAGIAGMVNSDSSGYQHWLAGRVREDLAEARMGLGGSSLKAALEVLRDLRDLFRYIVDFDGLTADSLEDFMRGVVPLFNRAVVGPQKERHMELLALLASGVAATPFGPEPEVKSRGSDGWLIRSTRLTKPYATHVDWICHAYTRYPSVDRSTSPLVGSLYRRGTIRRHRPGSRHVTGLAVDSDQHPIDAQGKANRRIWVLGPLCEGTTFYNHLVPSPRWYCRPVADAHRCVSAMFKEYLPTLVGR